MESTSRTADKTIDRITDTAHQAVDRAEEFLEMKDEWVEGARDYVREHPIAALGIAAAAGYVLSMLLRR